MPSSVLQGMISNAALLLVLAFLYVRISNRWRPASLIGQALNGVLFGGVAIGVMLSPLQLLPGVVFDTRSVVISVGGLFGGPLVAAITFIMASAFRVWQGGAGALMGVLVSLCSAALGTAYFYWKRGAPKAQKPLSLYAFGVVVHLVMLACALALPGDMTWQVLSRISLPVMMVYPVATLLLCLVIMDRENRVIADQKLKASEERYRRMVETSHEGIWVIDEARRTTFVNPQMAGMMGYAQEEMVGQPLGAFVFAEDMAHHKEQMKLRRQGEPAQYELRMRRKDGSPLWAQVSAAPIYEQGVFKGSLAMYTDITQRKRVEKAQDEARMRQVLAMDLAKVVHWEYDVREDVFTFNDQFYALYGTDAGEQGGYTMSAAEYARRFLPPEDVDVVGQEIGKVLATEDSSVVGQVDHRIARADGEERWISVRYGMIPGADGRIAKTHGVNQDITERRLTEQFLRESDERFRLAFETSPDAININRLHDGMYLEINQGFMDIMGYTREEVIGKTSVELNIWEDPADRAELVRGLRQNGFYANLEADFRRKDGSVTTGLMSASVIHHNGEPHIISVTRDIGLMRQTERERSELEEKLRQSQKMEALGTLAGGIAHDFNNILSAITGATELALDAAAQGEPAQDELQQIILSADRARELVRQILAFSRKGSFNPRTLDLNQTITQAAAIIERTIPKMISIELNLAPELKPISGDPNQLEQVLLNLASNAQDAMPEGGRLIIATADASLDQEYVDAHLDANTGGYVEVSFSDTGQGMDTETVDHIFEPFFTTKDIGKGTGLGLASVYGIVKGHGGHIDCHSEPGKGTTFKVYLPVLDAEHQPEEIEEASPILAVEGDETVLLVDDDEALRQIVARILRLQGYRVITAGSGEEALESLFRGDVEIDLVVMDLGMPGMGGHKALQEMLVAEPHTKVVIASGYSAGVQVKAALEAGAVGYVAKPFRRAELLAEVRRVLDQA